MEAPQFEGEAEHKETEKLSEGLDATLLDDYVKVAKKTIESCSRIVITAKEDGEIDARSASLILLHFLKLKESI